MFKLRKREKAKLRTEVQKELMSIVKMMKIHIETYDMGEYSESNHYITCAEMIPYIVDLMEIEGSGEDNRGQEYVYEKYKNELIDYRELMYNIMEATNKLPEALLGEVYGLLIRFYGDIMEEQDFADWLLGEDLKRGVRGCTTEDIVKGLEKYIADISGEGVR